MLVCFSTRQTDRQTTILRDLDGLSRVGGIATLAWTPRVSAYQLGSWQQLRWPGCMRCVPSTREHSSGQYAVSELSIMLASDTGSLQQAKLVLLGDMGAGKSSLVLRFVKGQFFDYQVRQDAHVYQLLALQLGRLSDAGDDYVSSLVCGLVQESTIGAAFLTKTLPEHNVKFEIW